MKNYTGEFDSVYFGGGTPSSLESSQIKKLLDCAHEHFSIDKNAEITIECNPSSKELGKKLYDYAEMGINRISLGMQSATDSERFALGRRAGKKEVLAAISASRSAGISNISLDLMLGTPKQTLSSINESLEFIAECRVPHISAYMLKIEENTKFYEMQSRLLLPSEDEVCDMYLKTVDFLESAGLFQYEISNFSYPGFESRHNLKYWTLCDYLGLGSSAHSLWNGRRFHFERSLTDFKALDDGEGKSPEEKIILSLRLTRGVEADLIKKDCSAFIEHGLMKKENGRISLTPKGFLISNSIICELI